MKRSLAFLILMACVHRDPIEDAAAASYGAARLRCVQENDAAAEARACFHRVDSEYGQVDGGK